MHQNGYPSPIETPDSGAIVCPLHITAVVPGPLRYAAISHRRSFRPPQLENPGRG